MKGISTIIATILMLMITLAMAGTAYLFINSAFTQQTQGIEIVDSFCSGGTQARFVFINSGTNPITFVNGACNPATANTTTCGSISVTRTSGGGTATITGDKGSLDPGTTATLIDNACTTTGTPRSCVYRITPPTGRTSTATISCSG